jgi:hypothetical protein
MENVVFWLVVLGCALIGIWIATAMTERTSALQKRVAALEGRMERVEDFQALPVISPELAKMMIERAYGWEDFRKLGYSGRLRPQGPPVI